MKFFTNLIADMKYSADPDTKANTLLSVFCILFTLSVYFSINQESNSMPPKRQQQQESLPPQKELIWGEFAAFAEGKGISLDHEKDWGPWWECFHRGYKTARIKPRDMRGYEEHRKNLVRRQAKGL